MSSSGPKKNGHGSIEPAAVVKLIGLTDQYSPAHRQRFQRATSQMVDFAGLCAQWLVMAAKNELK